MRIFELEGHRRDPTGGAGAVAIGNFDGVHLGHQRVIDQLLKTARDLDAPATVMTFEPYPREFFDPKEAPPRLSSCRHKFHLLRSSGISRVYCVRFGRRLAATSATDFVSSILVGRLAVQHVTVGVDFRFGSGRLGDVDMLHRLGREHGFGVTAVEDFTEGGERISSSRIRRLLADAELDSAARLLGRPFSYKGRVIHGDKRGRTWGFPTANLTTPRNSFPLKGVFVVELTDEDGFRRTGVANVGHRPTIGGVRLLIEVHLFDFNGDLYGRRVEVTFLHRIRDEQRFDDFEALKARIRQDVVLAEQWLEGRKRG